VIIVNFLLPVKAQNRRPVSVSVCTTPVFMKSLFKPILPQASPSITRPLLFYSYFYGKHPVATLFAANGRVG
jgi:hypothetical protein